jgi:hypothetical protein
MAMMPNTTILPCNGITYIYIYSIHLYFQILGPLQTLAPSLILSSLYLPIKCLQMIEEFVMESLVETQKTS